MLAPRREESAWATIGMTLPLSGKDRRTEQAVSIANRAAAGAGKPGRTIDVARSSTLRDDVSRPPQPQLPSVLLRADDLPQRHLDADHRPGLAGPAADQLQGGPGYGRYAPVPAHHHLLAVRRRHRRPCPQ